MSKEYRRKGMLDPGRIPDDPKGAYKLVFPGGEERRLDEDALALLQQGLDGCSLSEKEIKVFLITSGGEEDVTSEY